MKLGPVTKLDKRNTATLKNFDVDVMSSNCVIIVIFIIYGQPDGVNQNPDSERMDCKTYIFIKSFYLTKTENRTKKSLAQLSYYCYE